jgi:hypothetical protein
MGETSINFHYTTRRYNPEEIHLHTRRRENLKSSLTALMMEAASTSETSINFH